jgi:lambda repressor-like predicted transcriptional regulator
LIENGLIHPKEDEKEKLAKALGVKGEEIWGGLNEP